eukprot:3793748-Amphidinium_carterae.1
MASTIKKRHSIALVMESMSMHATTDKNYRFEASCSLRQRRKYCLLCVVRSCSIASAKCGLLFKMTFKRVLLASAKRHAGMLPERPMQT